MFLKVIPEIHRVRGMWCIPDFVPGPPAYDWPKYRGRKGIVYVLETAGFFKIGLTTDFKKRFSGIDKGTPLPVRKVATRTVPHAGLAYAEAWLHEQFKDRRIKGEWFQVTEAEALGILAKAVVRAKLYEDASAEWWWREHPHLRPYNPGGPIPVPALRLIP